MDGELRPYHSQGASFTRECDHIWLTILCIVKECAEYGAWITYGTQRAKLAYKNVTLYLNSDSNESQIK